MGPRCTPQALQRLLARRRGMTSRALMTAGAGGLAPPPLIGPIDVTLDFRRQRCPRIANFYTNCTHRNFACTSASHETIDFRSHASIALASDALLRSPSGRPRTLACVLQNADPQGKTCGSSAGYGAITCPVGEHAQMSVVMSTCPLPLPAPSWQEDPSQCFWTWRCWASSVGRSGQLTVESLCTARQTELISVW